MDREAGGFTLVELLIVIAIIAIVATIAIVNLLSARMSANEAAAIATLHSIITAQAQFQQRARADTDNDGTGEYGGFYELSGGGAGRMATVLTPPVLSGAFRVLNSSGQATRSGYLFRMYLPNAAGAGVGEPRTGFTRTQVNANLCETTWCAYAWPVNFARSGSRTFFTNQRGDVVATTRSTYSGTRRGPASDAAFTAPRGRITGSVAVGVVGNDGSTWKQVP